MMFSLHGDEMVRISLTTLRYCFWVVQAQAVLSDARLMS